METNIGEVIQKKRKKMGLTQEQLGELVGVSTAAVSKWELGKSYPDVTLIPKIAKIFQITIDELFQFKNTLSTDEVMEFFSECEKIMVSGNFQDGIDRAEGYLDEYPACYFLKFRMGFLIYMYSWKAENEAFSKQLLERSCKLFNEIIDGCDDRSLVEGAKFQLGALYSQLGKEDEAVEILKEIKKQDYDGDSILASIYTRKGEVTKARKIMQRKLYTAFQEVTSACTCLARTYEVKEDYYTMNKYIDLLDSSVKGLGRDSQTLFGIPHLRVMNALVHLRSGDNQRALCEIRKIKEIVKDYDLNRTPQFENIWCFDHLKQGKRTLTMDLNESFKMILDGVEFDPVRDSAEFKGLYGEIIRRC